jgi:hypothetical protein
MDYTPINEKKEGDSGFICSFGDKTIALYASSQWNAIKLARDHFKPAKSKQHLVSAMLAEKQDGSQHVHSTASI